MIEITKGNPTPEEIAALVAVLTLARGTTQPRRTSSTAGQWRRATPVAEVTLGAPSQRARCWRAWCAGWSRVGPARAPVPHWVQRDASSNVS
jgi:Acyl-CoA carboxylase epsilon subunit